MNLEQAIEDCKNGLSINNSSVKNGVARTTLQKHLKKL
jgi:lambda repressor-like predicted transcriptional regulator